MWQLLLVSPPAVVMWWLVNVVGQATGAPSEWTAVLAPLGAAAPFAMLAVYVIRRQEVVVDHLTAELQRVNDQVIDKFVGAINDATSLHRESTRMWEQVLSELRARRGP